MVKYKCQGCGHETDNAYRCGECRKILCDSCRESAYYCKDSTKGKAGCNGILRRLE